MCSLNLFLSGTGFQIWKWQGNYWWNLCRSVQQQRFWAGPPKRAHFTQDPSIWLEKGKLGNSILSWEITPRREQKVHRENAREGEREGDWNTVIRSSWNWKQSKTSSWLTSPRIIRNSFQLCGKSLSALSAQMPPWRNSMKWVSGKCQHGSEIRLPMAWLGEDRPERWGWWNNLWYRKHTTPHS